MARHATIIDEINDAWGYPWSVREYRDTVHGFQVAIGWPRYEERGAGKGGPQVIISVRLLTYLASQRDKPKDIRLPIGRTSIKRLRNILGHHWRIDRASWWEARTEDLTDLTIEAFCTKHDVSVGAVVNARHALFGPKLRPANWWKNSEVSQIILSDAPRSEIANELGISVGSLGRLRWALKNHG